MIIKTPQNVHKICFCVIWKIFTCDLKIDLIMFEPHYAMFIFMNLLHSPDIWLFDILITLLRDVYVVVGVHGR